MHFLCSSSPFERFFTVRKQMSSTWSLLAGFSHQSGLVVPPTLAVSRFAPFSKHHLYIPHQKHRFCEKLTQSIYCRNKWSKKKRVSYTVLLFSTFWCFYIFRSATHLSIEVTFYLFFQSPSHLLRESDKLAWRMELNLCTFVTPIQ